MSGQSQPPAGLEAGLRELITAIVRDEMGKLIKPSTPVTYISVKEYAKRHSISTSTVRMAIRQGTLPAQRVGRTGRAVRILATAEIGRPARPARANATANARAKLVGDGSVRE